MNKNFFHYTLFLLSVISFNCTSKVKQFKVSISIFTQQLSEDSNHQFPEEFKTVFLPFESEPCKDSFLFLSVTKDGGILVNRLDYTEKTEIKFDFSSGFSSDISNNVERMKRVINSSFSDKKIGKGFAKPNAKCDYTKLTQFQDRVVIYNDDFNIDSVIINDSYHKVFHSMDELKLFVSSDLCERFNAHKNYSTYAILYNIKLDSSEKKPNLDSDNDGVVDSLDKCPHSKGAIENFGCPSIQHPASQRDTDADGVVDSLDKCPTQNGSLANRGCPTLKPGNPHKPKKPAHPKSPGMTGTMKEQKRIDKEDLNKSPQ